MLTQSAGPGSPGQDIKSSIPVAVPDKIKSRLCFWWCAFVPYTGSSFTLNLRIYHFVLTPLDMYSCISLQQEWIHIGKYFADTILIVLCHFFPCNSSMILGHTFSLDSWCVFCCMWHYDEDWVKRETKRMNRERWKPIDIKTIRGGAKTKSFPSLVLHSLSPGQYLCGPYLLSISSI